MIDIHVSHIEAEANGYVGGFDVNVFYTEDADADQEEKTYYFHASCFELIARGIREFETKFNIL